MKRWNGWGNEEILYPVPEAARAFLADALGPPQAAPTAGWAEMLATAPASRLPAHPLIDTSPAARLRHARGHSLPDWAALRFGVIPHFPDGVAYPSDEAQTAELLAWACAHDIRLIPYGGGSSVVGHITPTGDEGPVLTVDMTRQAQLHQLDETSRLATFGAGVSGPHLEAQLRARGYTLGHFPQSFEYSTLGGWIATRSSGQQSLFFGRIEDLFAGGRLLAPAGVLDLPPLPASAAGPDLRQLVLGSEGRLGILTTATMRVQSLPAREDFHAIFFPDWLSGVAAVREMAQAHLPLSMLRLSDPVETATTLILAGHARLIGLAERLLRTQGVDAGKCWLMLGLTGAEASVKQARRAALDIAARQRGVHTGRLLGKEWRKSRFRTPYLRNTLWEEGYAVDTMETALPWAAVPAAHAAITAALRTALAPLGERAHAFAHLSHLYADGASIYSTVLFRIAPTLAETLDRWQRLKDAASAAIVAHGGTISHQHGVGRDHLPWLAAEKGALGLQALATLTRAFDPEGRMNPGKLVGSG